MGCTKGPSQLLWGWGACPQGSTQLEWVGCTLGSSQLERVRVYFRAPFDSCGVRYTQGSSQLEWEWGCTQASSQLQRGFGVNWSDGGVYTLRGLVIRVLEGVLRGLDM